MKAFLIISALLFGSGEAAGQAPGKWKDRCGFVKFSSVTRKVDETKHPSPVYLAFRWDRTHPRDYVYYVEKQTSGQEFPEYWESLARTPSPGNGYSAVYFWKIGHMDGGKFLPLYGCKGLLRVRFNYEPDH